MIDVGTIRVIKVGVESRLNPPAIVFARFVPSSRPFIEFEDDTAFVYVKAERNGVIAYAQLSPDLVDADITAACDSAAHILAKNLRNAA